MKYSALLRPKMTMRPDAFCIRAQNRRVDTFQSIDAISNCILTPPRLCPMFFHNDANHAATSNLFYSDCEQHNRFNTATMSISAPRVPPYSTINSLTVQA